MKDVRYAAVVGETGVVAVATTPRKAAEKAARRLLDVMRPTVRVEAEIEIVLVTRGLARVLENRPKCVHAGDGPEAGMGAGPMLAALFQSGLLVMLPGGVVGLVDDQAGAPLQAMPGAAPAGRVLH